MQEYLGVSIRAGLDSCTSQRDIGLCMGPRGLCWGLTGRSTNGSQWLLVIQEWARTTATTREKQKYFLFELSDSNRSSQLPIVAWFVVIEFSSCASFWLTEVACMSLVCDYEDRMLKNSGGRAVKHHVFHPWKIFETEEFQRGRRRRGPDWVNTFMAPYKRGPYACFKKGDNSWN